MMSAAMDAEAAARADALQREKRLQEKREKRRMLMEKEAIGLARNKQVQHTHDSSLSVQWREWLSGHEQLLGHKKTGTKSLALDCIHSKSFHA
jgi:hypothetical protein